MKSRNGLEVCFLGAPPNVGNMGVRALAASLTQLTVACDPAARICFLHANPNPYRISVPVNGGKVEVRAVNFRLSFKARFNEHILYLLLACCAYRLLPFRIVRTALRRNTPALEALASADVVGDIRGGDSFSDIYGWNRFITGALPAILAIIVGRNPILLPQTIGPFRSVFSKVVARWTLRHSAYVLARDSESLEVIGRAVSQSFARENCEFCPDVAFTLEPFQPAKPEIEPPLPPALAPIGLNVSSLLYRSSLSSKNPFNLKCNYHQFIARFVERLIEDTRFPVLLIPHDFRAGGDATVCRSTWERYQRTGRVHMLQGRYDQSELKWLIGQCEFFFGSRMHSCIAALSQAIPTVGLAYSRKFSGVFETAGAGELVVDLRQYSVDTAVERCIELLANRADFRQQLAVRIPEIQQAINGVFRKRVFTIPDQQVFAGTSDSVGVAQPRHIEP